MTIHFFKIIAQKYPNTAFLVKNTQARDFWTQIDAFFFLHKSLELDKFKGVDLKYDNRVLNSNSKYQNQIFLVQNLGIFVFS